MKQTDDEQVLVEQLQRTVPIRMRRMFGCIGIYSDELFFAVVKGNNLYFKVDSQNRPEYESYGMPPFEPYADGRQSKTFYQVPDAVIEQQELLSAWASAALAAAERKKRK